MKTQRWTRRKEERAPEILEAALACFAEKGFAGTRMDDIARRAGISKGTIYLYFESKERCSRRWRASPSANASPPSPSN